HTTTIRILLIHIIFFLRNPATTDIYTLSLHDALPILQTKMTISQRGAIEGVLCDVVCTGRFYDFIERRADRWGMVLRQPIYEKEDRKSTRLNSSHLGISYAVFCLKKKKNCTICSSCLW